MKIETEKLPEALRLRAGSLGPAGERWLAGLTDSLARLGRHWNFRPEQILGGGTESLVLAGSLSDESGAVLKIGLPGSCDCGNEARVLSLSQSQGYVRLLGHAAADNALLLERLGPSLADAGLSVEDEITLLCQTQQRAWQALPQDHGLMSGCEKAQSLAAFIAKLARELEHPCTPATITQARDFARERADRFDPARSVLVHGDAHAHNTLRVCDGSYRFVDPDGLWAEPALDLAIPMREYNDELLAGDAVAIGHARCRQLAQLTGIEARAIWQWGFLERVSTGLHLIQIGLDQWGLETLQIARHWTGQAPG